MTRLLTACLFVLSATAFAQLDVPELWGMRVHDEAGLLSPQMREQLETRLKQYEDSTSNQIAILIIPSLKGEVLEDYSLRVAEKWKLGQKEKDNGVLLLIAVEDRKMRIEVGYGLEGVLPDVICSRIIRNEIAPRFRRNEFDEGVWAGIVAITQAIGGEYTAGEGDGEGFEPLTPGEKALASLFVFTILGVFTFIGLKAKGAAGWFLYLFLIPFYAVFPGSILGFAVGIPILLAYLVGWPFLRFLFKRKGWITLTSSGGSSGSGGWFSGSSGWSSGGGGWSGGGGSFGGGGSSGGW
ncbi:MAG: TPM domain-containing protein [Cyclobacteriaceae bacterium]|nr:TPM domain-containing protein [Cyclobacteriaceae bacterium]MCX7637705.1 TPM domain-containing protein [Cyclobacteriaceae bacterium]MDW8330830.1 TPM domain-containing protein [Cyclobacteriaceae bacterium]